MKELKAGQWVKCIKTYELGGGIEIKNYPTKITKGKWYFIIDSKCIIKFNLNDFGWFSVALDKDVFEKHFDISNLLAYNPDEIEEARLKRKAAYEADMQKDKPKFKVGDKVRVIKQVEFLSIAEFGKDAVIDEDIGNNQYLISFNHPKTGKYCFRVTNDQIELIEEDHEEITPENLTEVLRYNGIDGFNVKVCDGNIYFENIHYKSIKRLVLDEENSKWLQHLELEVGKLKPLPKKKKKLTLEEALIELGFEKGQDNPNLGFNRYLKGSLIICSLIIFPSKYMISNYHTLKEEVITYTTKEQLAKDIATFEEKNRPHWSLVDDGGHGKEIGRIYRDEVENLGSMYQIGSLFIDNTLNVKSASLRPLQYIGKESNFIILCKDGSLIKAFWRNEE